MIIYITAAVMGLAIPVTQCEDAKNTVEMEDCLTERLQRSEQRVAELEEALTTDQSGRERRLSDRARMAWHLYRDLQCESEAERFRGGSMANVTNLQCRIRLTDQRRTDLESIRQPGRRD